MRSSKSRSNPRGRTWTVTIGSHELLPPSLENLLVARIDRQADEPTQACADRSRNREDVPGLRRSSSVSGVTKRRGAQRAPARRDRPRSQSRYPELECTFTHGLLREAALSTLTSTRKRVLYAEPRGGVRGDLCGVTPRPLRATRPLPRTGGKPAEGARVRRARSKRVELTVEPPVLGVPSEGLED